jgi:hypothetical protein
VITVKKNIKAYNEFDLVMKKVTAGKILTILNALEQWKDHSPLGEELYNELKTATTNSDGSDMLKI